MNTILRQTTKLVRGAAGLGVQTALAAGGAARRMLRGNPEPKREMDDATLKAKVESTVFRGAEADKGQVVVTVVDGIVELRGEVRRPEQVLDLEARVRSVPEVRGVQSLLRLPRTPPRKPRPAAAARGAKANARPRTGTQPTTAEMRRTRKPAAAGAKAEETPREKAAERKGRSAAPLGSTEG
jgi:hypothetical protein